MQPGLAEAFPGNVSGQAESAPKGADSLYQYTEMHQKPIGFKNGLVDPNPLLEYMDRCHCQDLHRSVPHRPGGHKLEFHHLYFPIHDYKNNVSPLSIRRLRNSKYNLIQMLSCQEDFYHRQSVVAVPQEEIDLQAAGRFLEEGELLTNYAASSALIAETHKAHETSRITRMAKAFLAARLALLLEIQEEDAKKLDEIELISSAIITGALTRYFEQKPEDGLRDMIKTRTENGASLIPTKTHKVGYLNSNAEARLQKRALLGSWVAQKLVLRPLIPEAA